MPIIKKKNGNKQIFPDTKILVQCSLFILYISHALKYLLQANRIINTLKYIQYKSKNGKRYNKTKLICNSK